MSVEVFGKNTHRRRSLDLMVQGRRLCYRGAADVRSLLRSCGKRALYTNVRVNGTVLRRRDLENVGLKNGDRVDFLYFIGGGSCSI